MVSKMKKSTDVSVYFHSEDLHLFFSVFSVFCDCDPQIKTVLGMYCYELPRTCLSFDVFS